MGVRGLPKAYRVPDVGTFRECRLLCVRVLSSAEPSPYAGTEANFIFRSSTTVASAPSTPSAPESARLSARPSGSALGPRSAPSRRFLPGLWINLSDRKYKQKAPCHVDQTGILSKFSNLVKCSSMRSKLVECYQAWQLFFQQLSIFVKCWQESCDKLCSKCKRQSHFTH